MRHRPNLSGPFRRAVLLTAIPLVLFLALSLGNCATKSETPQGERLPKVRIAADGRTFTTGRDQPFVPFGVNYYRPGTGWAPQLWKKFDPEATRKDFATMKALGVNCVRVFLTYGSFYSDAGALNPEGLGKFDRFLDIAEQAGIYVHPTGPDHWEGMPRWGRAAIEDESTLKALESFWDLFAARYKGRSVIFAYDLKNEPEVPWTSAILTAKWRDWLSSKYGTSPALTKAWASATEVTFADAPVPEPREGVNVPALLDYQLFRESVADEWTRRQVQAIKAADSNALVTVGLIQWSVPVVLGSLKQYAAFRPERQARWLDFLEVHFYPLANGAFEYRNREEELANIAYLESVVREVAKPGKPVVLAEFGWYGGGKPRFDGSKHPEASEAAHARYCAGVVETSAGYATGWLNWGLFDQPEATDCSELTGLLKPDGTMKEWGRAFSRLAARYTGTKIAPKQASSRPDLDWSKCLTSSPAAKAFRDAYRQAFEPPENLR